MAIKRRGEEVLGGLYTGINTKHIFTTSNMVEEYSGLKLQPHKAIVGPHVNNSTRKFYGRTHMLQVRKMGDGHMIRQINSALDVSYCTKAKRSSTAVHSTLWIMWCISVTADTCVAMDEWIQNPTCVNIDLFKQK
ncbi:hypothetical protein H5410_061583 [Solanum commersonii]|uniref:Uncharacterized protein n=1 Tax=Solanum commersonii TaxID=4109 RepID=A0A9J5W8F3_SOLCO|nr:hypothetical protein H5410_061583 [Solanum commersonii]